MKEDESDASVVHVLKGKLEETLSRGCHFNCYSVIFLNTVYHYITDTISISLVESSVKSLAIELQWPKGISFKKNEQRATEGFLNRKL